MSEPPAAESETSTDDDFISEHMVTELISHRFDDLLNQTNDARMLELEDTEQDLLDKRLLKSFEELKDLLRASSSVTENSIPSQSLMLMGPHPLVSDDTPTCTADDSSPVSLGCKPNIENEHTHPGTSKSISQSENKLTDQIQPLTERKNDNSFSKDPKQDVDNHTKEPEPVAYNPLIELQEYERNVVSEIITDEATKNIVMQDIDEKLTEIENSVAEMYQKLVVANIEYQKLMRYKEEINRNQPNATMNETDDNGEDQHVVEENL
ncbi:hypothetical protein WDU94_011935 [Cyamophila willieti]